MQSIRQLRLTLQVAIAFTWAGLVLGLSFIETPLKFQAPGITDALAVGIGRLVFTALNRIELGLSVIFAGTLLAGRRDVWIGALFAVVVAIVLLQTLWLLPVLDARVQLLLDGRPQPASLHHVMYIVVEAAKVITLFALGSVAVVRSRAA